MANALFQLFRGTLDKIKAHVKQDGNMYLDKETQCLYTDINDTQYGIRAKGLVYESEKLFTPSVYRIDLDGNGWTVQNNTATYTVTNQNMNLICGNDNIPPIILPFDLDSPFDYLTKVEVTDSHTIVFIIQMQIDWGEDYIPDFSVLILDTK